MIGRKVWKYIRRVILIIIVITVVFILVSFINHKVQMNKAKALLTPLGDIVQVNGHNMSVYSEGNGDKTLVFLSGGGTCSPILDFKSLYSLLSNDYRIVVIEKFGYGFSDIVNENRSIDVVLSETRSALKAANVEGPFVLCPHSMSGIEALYWAQTYPEEVEAIVGLDMAVPESYENYDINMFTIRLGQFAANVGITRWIPGIAESDAIKYGTLTDNEKDIYRAVFFSRTATAAMIDEVQCILDSAKTVGDGRAPNVPMLFFISNGTGTGWDKETWRNTQKEYLKNIADGRYVEFDCPHYIHDYVYVELSEYIRDFLNELY